MCGNLVSVWLCGLVCERGFELPVCVCLEGGETQTHFLPAAFISWDFWAALVSGFAPYFPSLVETLL